MNAHPDKLKDTIEHLNIVYDEKKVLLQLLGKMEKELKVLNLR